MTTSKMAADGIRLIQGDALTVLKTLPSESIHMAICSPPYWHLRSYLDNGHADKSSEIGMEDSVEQYVDNLVTVFHEMRRVLRADATFWLNIADSYAGAGYSNQANTGGARREEGGKQHHTLGTGLPQKSLLMVPARVALALQQDNWLLRSTIIWSKPNPMPESTTDRPTTSHEYIFMFAKQGNYFYDAEAIKVLAAETTLNDNRLGEPTNRDYEKANKILPGYRKAAGSYFTPIGNARNAHTVWEIPTTPFAMQLCTACGAVYDGAEYRRLPEDADQRRVCACGRADAWLSHYACVDEETECLTMTGWKKYHELRRGELMAAYDMEQGTLRYEPLLGVNVYDYDGELHQLGGRGLSVVCTPNHRCIVKTKNGKVNILRADELHSRFSMPCAADWDDGTFGSPDDPGVIIAELLGWAVTEGHLNNTTVAISQSLTANPTKTARIESLIQQAGFHYNKFINTRGPRMLPNGKYYEGEKKEATFQISGHGAQVLKGFMGKDKVPSWHCFLWSKESITALLEGIMQGDGHKRKDDGRICVTQKNHRFIGVVQILVMRLGYRCTVSLKNDGQYVAYIVKHQWHGLRGTDGADNVLKKIPYVGKVWCPSMPSGTFVARRRGRVWITGNSYPEALVRPMVRAGTSEYGVCGACGAPYERVMERIEDDRPKRDGSMTKAAIVGPAGSERRLGPNGWNLPQSTNRTTGWTPTCACNAPVRPSVVLDIFSGTGTTCTVAMQEGRHAVGIDLNDQYLKLSAERIRRAAATLRYGKQGAQERRKAAAAGVQQLELLEAAP